MKQPTFLSIAQMFPDVIDGPGWTDVDVNGCYESDGKYVPPQCSSHPTPENHDHTDTSI